MNELWSHGDFENLSQLTEHKANCGQERPLVTHPGKGSYYIEDNSGRCVMHHKLSTSKNLGNMEEKFIKDI